MLRKLKAFKEKCLLKIYSKDLKELTVQCNNAQEAVAHEFLQQDWVYLAHITDTDNNVHFVRVNKNGKRIWKTKDDIK